MPHGDGRFGVVLIERGYEVGGGDTRFAVGTVARIVEAARTPDGRYLLATVGTERLPRASSGSTTIRTRARRST